MLAIAAITIATLAVGLAIYSMLAVAAENQPHPPTHIDKEQEEALKAKYAPLWHDPEPGNLLYIPVASADTAQDASATETPEQANIPVHANPPSAG